MLGRDEAIRQGLIEARLNASDRDLVDHFLDRADDCWRDCCGGGCEPCILAVARAVDTARRLL